MVSLLEEPINKTEIQESQNEPATDGGGSGLPPARSSHGWLPICSVFALSLMARLWFNFGTVHQNAYAAADASEYLRYADALAKIISGQTSGPLAESLKEFVITGPALPVFLLLATALTGQHFDPANSALALAAQSVISALTCVLVYLIVKLVYEGKTALYAGLLAACYPAFIVNSGRLYSETLATFIECLAVLLIVRGFFQIKAIPANNFFLGSSLIMLELARSAMVLLTAVSLPIVFLQGLFSRGLKQKDWRQALLRLALLLGGATLVLAPWFIFEKAAYNKMTLAVDRVGHYNLFVGTNTEIQGFLSYPYPDGRGIEEKSFPTLIREAFVKSPSRFIKLMLDKPARLLKCPWNDFRTPIGPFEYKAQVALHQAILLLSIIGVLLACLVAMPQPQQTMEGKAEPLDRQKVCGRLTLIFVFALNLPYLAFITVPRYNLTAMPFVIIFAAAGLTTLASLLKANPLAKAPKALLIVALCLFIFLRDDLKELFIFGQDLTASLIFVQGRDLLAKGLISAAFGLAFFISIYFCLPLMTGYQRLARWLTFLAALIIVPLIALPQRANGRFGEGILTLERKDEAIAGTIPLALPSAAKDGQEETWYLLIDSEDATMLGSKVDLTINGQKITGPLIPAISALDDWHYLKQFANGRAYLECSWIFDCMTQPSAMTNLDLRQWLYLPVTPGFIAEARRRGCLNVSLKHLVNEPTKLFGAALGKGSATIPSRALYSWEKTFYGVENDCGLTDSRYDERVAPRQANWTLNFGKSSEALDQFDLNLRLLRLKSSPIKSTEISASGTKDVSLPLGQIIKEGPLSLVRATLSYSPNYKPAPNQEIKVREAQPLLSLDWLDDKDRKITLPLPWLKKTPDIVDIAIPCDLQKIKGHALNLHARYLDPACNIKLGARAIAAHPIFGDGSLF